jgi:hypothetical protein
LRVEIRQARLRTPMRGAPRREPPSPNESASVILALRDNYQAVGPNQREGVAQTKDSAQSLPPRIGGEPILRRYPNSIAPPITIRAPNVSPPAVSPPAISPSPAPTSPIPQDLESRQFASGHRTSTNGRSDINSPMNGAATPGDEESPMLPEYVDLLQKYELSRLAEETGPLEYVTGLEFMKMLELAMHPDYQILWSRRRVTEVETEEELISRVGSRRCAKEEPTGNELAVTVQAETPTQITTDAPNSPVTDRSPSPSLRTYLCTTKKFQYSRFSFADRDLPMLSISYHNPNKQSSFLCTYGGYDDFEEITYLSAPEYLALLHDQTNSM